MSKYEEQKKRIALILSDGDINTDLGRSPKTVQKYLNYLKENIEFPCIMTGIEDFPWEEKFIFGSDDEEEYENLKKTNPSYKDIFELLEFDDTPNDQIIVQVRRLKDKKKFYLALDYLESIDKNTKNYQLLDDYACWYVNY
jgi:hypothetical protein